MCECSRLGAILDQSASKMLRSSGWSQPDLGYLPKGKEILEQYIKPLGELPDIARNLHLNARVTAVTRDGLGKLQTAEREQAPFVVHWEDAEGRARQTLAEAVIDASGTWGQPSPVGVGGIPVPGRLMLLIIFTTVSRMFLAKGVRGIQGVV